MCRRSPAALAWPLGLALAVALIFSGAPAQAQRAPPCTIVFGHARNVPTGEPSSGMPWDGVNRAMAWQVADVLEAHGIRSVRMLLPGSVSDVPAIIAALLERAAVEGCARIVETTLFASDDGLVVARLRAYPVLREGTVSSIGEPLHTEQQEVANTQHNRDRLVPAALGKAFAEEYLRRAGESTAAAQSAAPQSAAKQ